MERVRRVRRWFVEEGREMALSPYKTPNRQYETKLDGRQEAHLLCSLLIGFAASTCQTLLYTERPQVGSPPLDPSQLGYRFGTGLT